tara:strand:- start:207 stop:491 length:285 start_codon:yes stop_codon:yes gene_type:complete
MSTKIVRSIIPIAPVSYDSTYLNQLARALDNVIEDQRTPIVNLSNIPNISQANGLSIGDLYEANGFLKIVVNGDIFAGTSVGTTAVGTVTVVIS